MTRAELIWHLHALMFGTDPTSGTVGREIARTISRLSLLDADFGRPADLADCQLSRETFELTLTYNLPGYFRREIERYLNDI